MGRSRTIKYCVVNTNTFKMDSYKFDSIKEFKEHLKDMFGYSSYYSIVHDLKSVYGNSYIINDLFISGIRVI